MVKGSVTDEKHVQAAIPVAYEERSATRLILLAGIVPTFASVVSTSGRIGGRAQSNGGFRKSESRPESGKRKCWRSRITFKVGVL
jgi:hypothetical protein